MKIILATLAVGVDRQLVLSREVRPPGVPPALAALVPVLRVTLTGRDSREQTTLHGLN